jgi:two-component system sensor histidine kinase VicK
MVILVMIVSGTLIITLIRNSAYKTLDNQLKQAIEVIQRGLESDTSDGDLRQELINTISGRASLASDYEVLLYDYEGYEIFPMEGKTKNLRHVIVTSISGKKPAEVAKGVMENTDGTITKYRDYAEPVLVEDKVAYVIYSKATTSSVEDNLRQSILIIATSVVVALVLASILGLLLANTLTQPIRELTKNAKKIAGGELNIVMDPMSGDEIGELTLTFNTMAKELNKTLSEVYAEKNKLEAVFGHMTDGILVFDSKGCLVHQNPASGEFFDIGKKSTFKEVFEDWLDLEDIELNETEETKQHVISIKNRYLNICLAPYKFVVEENDIGIIVVIQDITKHKKLEELQKEFVANVSHELRTPITTIKSYAETLLEGEIDDPEISKRFLGVINSESDRMTVLVHDLLELSKLDNRQINFEMEPLNISLLTSDVVEKYKAEAIKKAQTIQYEESKEKLTVQGDANRIIQVVRNIVGNAIKYSQEGANIKVSVTQQDNYAVIKVSDNGFGIPAEDLPRIFERFYRVDKARSRAMGGTGLGLAIAKEIIEHHGGMISVESEIDKGTTFYIKLKLLK